jgi:Carboxypeptidase regulatory-like domain
LRLVASEQSSIAAKWQVVAPVEQFAWISLYHSTGWKLPAHLPLILFLALCSIRDSSAQTTTSGGLTGVVSDPSHAVVPDAILELRDSAKGTIQTSRTNVDGVYRFFLVAPGRCTLTVSHAGFRQERRDINVLLGPPGTMNITLKIASESATVKVTSEVPMLREENGDVSTTMTQLQVSQVPNPGNDLTYIAQTAPGAIMNTDTIYNSYLGNFSVLGMPGTSNLFTLNGMNNNNIQLNTNNSGALGMMLGQNEIQEATIVSNGYSGQFGGAAGANINYLTKSGGNDFHGNAAYYWNGTAFNANDWIDNAFGNPRPFDIANQWAGSIGGPIKKGKLFFFFDTEGMRFLLPFSSQVVLPSAKFESASMANIDSIFGPVSASHKFYQQMFNLYNSTPGASTATSGNFNPQDPTGCNGWMGPEGLGTIEPCAVHFLTNVDRPSSESIISGRVDWNIGTSDRVFLFVQYDHGNRAVYVDPISSLFDAYDNQLWWQGQLSWTHTIGPTAANQFLLAGTYINQVTGVANSAQTLTAFPTTLNWYNAGSPFAGLGGFDYLYALPGGSRTAQYQISDDLTKTRGKHEFRIGANFVRTYWTGNGYNFSGTGELLPQSISAFFSGGVDPANPGTDFTALYQTYPVATWNRFAFDSLGLYGQDEWHARSNLALTFALRADHQSNPVCETRCFARLAGPFDSVSHDPNQPYNQAILVKQKQAFLNTDSIVWSPRVSFAWQPLGVSRNTVIRGGVGVFYDPVPGALGSSLAFNPPLSNFFALSGYNLAPDETNSLSQNAYNSNTAFLKGFAAGQTLAQIQATDPNFTPPSFQNPANTIHSPQYQKWSLQAQQSFGTSTSFTVGYFGNHGIHEFFYNPNANAYGFGSFPTGPCSGPPVPPCYDPRFAGVTQYETSAISNYNGMVVSFEQRFSRWGSGTLQVNYTYGHALDEVSNGGIAQFAFGSSVFPQDPNNLRGSYGAADYDVRHSFNANYVWEVPVKEALRGHGSDYLVKGWQLSGTIFARTGFPYTVIDGTETGNLINNNFFGTIYAVPVVPLGSAGPCGKGAVIPSSPVPCQPAQVLADGSPSPGALFVQTGCETGFNTGTLPGPKGPCTGPSVTFEQGRNRFRGPSYFDTDFAVMKNTKIPHWENGVLGIGFQFFNLFNHANFGFPDISSSDVGFGQIFYMEQAPTSILGSGLNANVSPRMIQLRVQLQF